MRLSMNSATRGIAAMGLLGSLLVGGCDASKPELEATKTKLTAITTERDGLKAQLAATQAALASAKKDLEATNAKLAAATAPPPEKPPEPQVAEPVVAKVAPAAAPAQKIGKKPTGAKSGTLGTALLEKGPAVQQCAIEHALDKGAKKVVASVRVTINSSGQVVDSTVTANVTDGDGSKVKACIENVVRSAKFPPVPTPLATDERSWTVAAE